VDEVQRRREPAEQVAHLLHQVGRDGEPEVDHRRSLTGTASSLEIDHFSAISTAVTPTMEA
jgi:hypothetical protein